MKHFITTLFIMTMVFTLFAGGISLSSTSSSYTIGTQQNVEIMNLNISVTPFCTESYNIPWITIAVPMEEIYVSEISSIHVSNNNTEIPVEILSDNTGNVINIHFINSLTVSESSYCSLKIYGIPSFPTNQFRFSLTGIQTTANEIYGLPVYGNWVHVIQITGNILSVPNQFPSIQSAINAATAGDTVLVRNGTYLDNINFMGKSIVVASRFIIDNNEDNIWATVICGNNNGTIVTFNNNENRNSKLIGFRLIGGTNGNWGGGIKIINSSPVIQNCIIQANHSNIGGGGIYIENYDNGLNGLTNPRLQNCLVAENSSINGAGIFMSGGNTEIINCTVVNNSAITAHMSNINFAGLYLSAGAKAIVANSIIFNNKKTNYIDWEYANIGFYFAFTADTLLIVSSDYQDIDNQNNGVITYCDGNITENPGLNSQYTLNENSPCIDSGYFSYSLSGIEIFNLQECQYYGDSIDMGWQETNYLPTINNNQTVPVITPNLGNAFPNPFNSQTSINYSLPKANSVTIDIFNAKGQKIKTLVSEMKGVGSHAVIWNGTDQNNKSVSNGIYFYRMTSGKYTASKKIILVK